MKTLTLPLIMTFLILTIINCEGDKPNTTKTPKDLLKHSIYKEDVYEAPIKTQVTLDLLIEDKEINEKKIKDLLNYFYDKTIKRSGFKHHDHPTNIYIYAYTSKDKAESGMGQWIGMISKSYDDIQPKINVSDTQLNSVTLKPVEKFGLSENIRLEIWNKSIMIEDRAQKEADIQHPLDKVGTTINDIKKNSATYDKLEEKYKKKLATEYGINISIIDSIGVEGLTKGWPFPQK